MLIFDPEKFAVGGAAGEAVRENPARPLSRFGMVRTILFDPREEPIPCATYTVADLGEALTELLGRPYGDKELYKHITTKRIPPPWFVADDPGTGRALMVYTLPEAEAVITYAESYMRRSVVGAEGLEQAARDMLKAVIAARNEAKEFVE